MEDNFKKCCKYKTDDRNCLLCMEEKLAIASHNNPNELLNQWSEMLNAYRHIKKAGSLANRMWVQCIFLAYFYSFWLPLYS